VFAGRGGSGTPADATQATAGNIFSAGGALKVTNSIVAAGVASGGTNNCKPAAVASGHNIEDDAEGQCGFDMAGVNPLLQALADNGGPTKTMALGAGSPAIDAAGPGGCVEGVDQRGIARPQPGGGLCDLGAFELVPSPKPPPPIPPPPAVTPPGPVKPRLAALRLKPSSFRAKAKGVKKYGTKITYTLSLKGSVKFTVERRSGKKFKSVRGSFTHKSKQGANKLKFTGVLAKHPLVKGSYRLVATPTAGTLKGTARTASFKIR
jgi:hypothetical protein